MSKRKREAIDLTEDGDGWKESKHGSTASSSSAATATATASASASSSSAPPAAAAEAPAGKQGWMRCNLRSWRESDGALRLDPQTNQHIVRVGDGFDLWYPFAKLWYPATVCRIHEDHRWDMNIGQATVVTVPMTDTDFRFAPLYSFSYAHFLNGPSHQPHQLVTFPGAATMTMCKVYTIDSLRAFHASYRCVSPEHAHHRCIQMLPMLSQICRRDLTSSHWHQCITELIAMRVEVAEAVSQRRLERIQVLDAQLAKSEAVAATVDAANARSRCVICLDESRGIVFRPCGHVCACNTCGSARIKRSRRLTTCPICRAEIKSRSRVYIS